MYIDHKESTLYVEIIGEGEPLVFIHGNGEDHTVFSNQIDFFKKNHKLILIDTRMHGKSKSPLSEYSINDLAKDVEYILQTLKIVRATFIGFSDGANILFELSRINPQIIKKAIAISGNLNPKGLKLHIRTILKLQNLYFKITKNKLKQSHYHLMLKEPQISLQALNQIKTPFLIIAGSNDLIKTKHTKQIASTLKNSKLHIVPKANHFAITKKPTIINEIIKDYISNDN